MFPAYVGTLVGGTVAGMIVGDALGAIPTTANVPATSNSAVPKVTSDGTPVNSNTTPRQHLFTSAAIVIAALAILFGGSRVLRDARIS